MNLSLAQIAIALMSVALVALISVAYAGRDGTQTERPSAAAGVSSPGEVIEVRGGEPVGGAAALSYERGDRVRLVVRGDAQGPVYLSGYDIAAEVAPGRSGRLSFRARRPGTFRLRLVNTDELLAQITVKP